MSFERDVYALRVALQETERRIQKLQEHKESAKRQLGGGGNAEHTVRRLDRNLERLEQKRRLILRELSG